MIGNLLIRFASFTFQKCLIFSAILGGIYYVFMFDDGSSIQTQISQVETKVKEQEGLSKQSDLALKEVEQVRTTVGALSEQFKTVSQALPSEVAMADIIRTVDFVSRKSGVTIKVKEPKPVVNREFYEEIPLRITMDGSYAEITTFLYFLASTERLMKVNNFIMTTSPPVKGSPPTGRLLFDGHILSYRFIGNPAPPPPPKTPNSAKPAAKPAIKPTGSGK